MVDYFINYKYSQYVFFWVTYTKLVLKKKPRCMVLVMISCAFIYMMVAMYRSLFPRIDVERIVLFKSQWSDIFMGRTLATIAEIVFILQWCILIYSNTINTIDNRQNKQKAMYVCVIIMMCIITAECLSWYGVVTRNNIYNMMEEILWTVAFLFIGRWSFVQYGNIKLPKHKRQISLYIFVGVCLYIIFMVANDIPLYLSRYKEQKGKKIESWKDGLKNIRHVDTYKVTSDWTVWKDDAMWLGLYFSLGVTSSIVLCYLVE